LKYYPLFAQDPLLTLQKPGFPDKQEPEVKLRVLPGHAIHLRLAAAFARVLRAPQKNDDRNRN